MQLELDVLVEALGATVENPKLVAPGCSIIRFETADLKYALQIDTSSDTVVFSFDKTEPIQPTPILEFSFRCSLIDCYSKVIGGTNDGICFFERQSEIGLSGGISDIRLRLIRIIGGSWYAWCNSR